jgi:carbonic anhydrase
VSIQLFIYFKPIQPEDEKGCWLMPLSRLTLSVDAVSEVNQLQLKTIIMKLYNSLLEGNKQWVRERLDQDPEYFERLSKGQSPQFLWIGCSDSRVPANEITHTQPGDIFVHRNIANMVVHSDMNMLSVLDYAVNILKVKHVIVCGHYGCGGVKAAMENQQFGLVDNWLRFIKDVYRTHQHELDAIKDPEKRFNRFAELNVIEQVFDLTKTTIIQNAWRERNEPKVHGWIYELKTGLIKDLGVSFDSTARMPSIFRVNNDAESTVSVGEIVEDKAKG